MMLHQIILPVLHTKDITFFSGTQILAIAASRAFAAPQTTSYALHQSQVCALPPIFLTILI